jgi:hypothetical protein
MELLFARLPPALRRAAIRRTAAFLLDSSLASVGAEASVLCNAIAWADPEVKSSWDQTVQLLCLKGAQTVQLLCLKGAGWTSFSSRQVVMLPFIV